MNTGRFFIAGIAGGIVYFLLGWVTYGMLLGDFMNSAVAGVDRGELIYWALAIGNLSMGFVLSYVINRGGSTSVSSATAAGALIGLLFSAGFDLIMYATTNLATLHQIAADIIAFTVLSAIAGAVVGLASRRGTVSTA